MGPVLQQNSVPRRESHEALALQSGLSAALPSSFTPRATTSTVHARAHAMTAPPAAIPSLYAASGARGNVISLESFGRKRPLDTLSPLPSPLFSFMTTPSSSVAASGSSDLPSLRLSPGTPSYRDGGAQQIGNSLKFVVPAATKRVRREAPTSPCSVGEVNGATQPSTTSMTATKCTPGTSKPPMAPAAATPANSASMDKIRSVVRGLEHVSRCEPNGCSNPLCVSTRGFMNKVTTHLIAMAGKPGHIAEKCGACRLWLSIVRSHTSICMEANCNIPLCPSNQSHELAAADMHNACRRRERRDDNDDEKHPRFIAQQ